MKIVALIPARYDSTRFPGKLMADLGGKSVILNTYLRAKSLGLFEEVKVITNSQVIFDEITNNNGEAILNFRNHETGTDRIAEYAHLIDADVFVNIQGDEPFIAKEPLVDLINQFDNPDVKVASLIQLLQDKDSIENPNFVKVVVDKNNDALFFSRSPIPFVRDNYPFKQFYEHIGVYAFRKNELMNFANWEQTILEKSEKIECLRFLENGIKIRMVVTKYMGIEIDTIEDLQKANDFLNI